MNRPRLLLSLTLTLAIGLASACGPDDQQPGPGAQPTAEPTTTSTSATPTPTPTPTPTTKPSVDPRTAAITKAVSRYYSVTDGLYRKPNRAPWRKLQTVSRDEAFLTLQDELLTMYRTQQHATGSTKWKLVKIDKVQKKGGHLQANVTTCWDVSTVDVVNKQGKSVINKKKRPNRGSDALALRQDGKTWYVVRDRDGHAKC